MRNRLKLFLQSISNRSFWRLQFHLTFPIHFENEGSALKLFTFLRRNKFERKLVNKNLSERSCCVKICRKKDSTSLDCHGYQRRWTRDDRMMIKNRTFSIRVSARSIFGIGEIYGELSYIYPRGMFEFHGTFLPILKFWSYALKYFEIIITTQFGWNGTLPRSKKGEKRGNEGSQNLNQPEWTMNWPAPSGLGGVSVQLCNVIFIIFRLIWTSITTNAVKYNWFLKLCTVKNRETLNNISYNYVKCWTQSP